MSDQGIGDRELLEQFTHTGSHEAFTLLVHRYVDLVYATCYRDLHDHHLAEDAVQAVFIVLAQKAKSLRREVVLAGWLYQTARLTVRNARKREARRKNREHRAAEMQRQTSPRTLTWDSMSPLVGDGLDKLPAADREAILLHYFQRKTHAEVGAALGVSEDAARMRVGRAIEKLREFFSRKGHTMALAALTTLLMASAGQAAPPSCAAGILAAVYPVAGAAAVATASAHVLADATMKSMLMAKVKIAAAVAATLLLVPTIGLATYQALARPNELPRGVAVVDAPSATAASEPAGAKPASGMAEAAREPSPKAAAPSKPRPASADLIRFHVENGQLSVSAPATPSDGKLVRMSLRGIQGTLTVARSPAGLKIENNRSTTDGGLVETHITYQPGANMLVQRTVKPRSGKEYALVLRQTQRSDPGQSPAAGQITLQVTSDGGENWVSWTAEDFRRFQENYPLAYLAHMEPLFRDFTSRYLCMLPVHATRQALAPQPPAGSTSLTDVLGSKDGAAALLWRREIEMLQRDRAFLIDCLECDELDVRAAALKRLSERLGKPIAFDLNDPPDKRRASAAALRRTFAGSGS